jgi:hypothetical protein
LTVSFDRSIQDKDGPIVTKHFYEALFKSELIDSDSVSHALDEAVGKLKMSGTNPERWASFIHMGA